MLIRLNPGVAPDTHEAMSTGGEDAKFGLPPELAPGRCARPRRARLRLAGVHIHIGSQIRDVAPFAESVRALRVIVDDLDLADLAVYDLGGGLGVRYTRGEQVPTVEDYMEGLIGAVREHLPAHARILIEPGRSLVATPASASTAS